MSLHEKREEHKDSASKMSAPSPESSCLLMKRDQSTLKHPLELSSAVISDLR